MDTDSLVADERPADPSSNADLRRWGTAVGRGGTVEVQPVQAPNCSRHLAVVRAEVAAADNQQVVPALELKPGMVCREDANMVVVVVLVTAMV